MIPFLLFKKIIELFFGSYTREGFFLNKCIFSLHLFTLFVYSIQRIDVFKFREKITFSSIYLNFLFNACIFTCVYVMSVILCV